jgi:hypothetical protein
MLVTLTPHAFKHCALVMLAHCCCAAAMRALAMPMPHALAMCLASMLSASPCNSSIT